MYLNLFYHLKKANRPTVGLLSLAVLLCSFQSPPADSLYIVVNTNDCFSCYAATRGLLAEQKNQKKVIFLFREQDRQYAPRFLRDQLKLNAEQLHYRVSDKLYQRYMGKNASSQLVLFAGRKFYKSPLKNYGDSPAILKALEQSGGARQKTAQPQMELLADLTKIAFSNHPQLTAVTDSLVVLYDYNYGTAAAVRPGRNSSPEVYDAKTWTLRYLYSLYFGDTATYTKSLPELKVLSGIGKNEYHIEMASAAHDTVLLTVALPFAVKRLFQSKQTLMVESQYLLLVMHKHKIISYYVVPEHIKDDYYFDATSVVLPLGPGRVGVALFKEKLAASNHTYAELRAENGQLAFSRMLGFELPEFFVRNNVAYQSNELYHSGSLVFYPVVNEYHDLVSNKNGQLPKAVAKPQYKQGQVVAPVELADVRREPDGTVRYLSVAKNIFRTGTTAQNEIRVELPTVPLSNARLFTGTTIVYLDKQSKLVAVKW